MTSHSDNGSSAVRGGLGQRMRRCGQPVLLQSLAQSGCPQGVDNGHAQAGPEAVIHPPPPLCPSEAG
jgi:hypothetical protein